MVYLRLTDCGNVDTSKAFEDSELVDTGIHTRLESIVSSWTQRLERTTLFRRGEEHGQLVRDHQRQRQTRLGHIICKDDSRVGGEVRRVNLTVSIPAEERSALVATGSRARRLGWLEKTVIS